MDLCANGTRFPSQNSTESSKINELSTKKLKSLVLSEKSLKSLISDRHPPPPRGGVQVASWRHILSNVSTFSRDLSRMAIGLERNQNRTLGWVLVTTVGCRVEGESTLANFCKFCQTSVSVAQKYFCRKFSCFK